MIERLVFFREAEVKRFVLILGLALLAGCSPEKSSQPSAAVVFEKDGARIVRQDGTATVLTVEIADTNAKRERGLMYRTGLRDDQGMLFLFPVDQRIGMWMANTPEPLDMIFIDRRGEIKEIVENTVPFSHDEIRSQNSVRAVLEVKAGFCAKTGVKTGDLVEHAFFKLEKHSATR